VLSQKYPGSHAASDVHVAVVGFGQVTLTPSHAYTLHAGAPGSPAGATLHVPCFVGRLQESQLLVQELLQQ
jgi:hypothetical protein